MWYIVQTQANNAYMFFKIRLSEVLKQTKGRLGGTYRQINGGEGVSNIHVHSDSTGQGDRLLDQLSCLLGARSYRTLERTGSTDESKGVNDWKYEKFTEVCT
jgi:hypothetical protein